jgi:hypothetical protein
MSPGMANGRCMFRLAQRVASVATWTRPEGVTGRPWTWPDPYRQP